jgi:hypothetical protein
MKNMNLSKFIQFNWFKSNLTNLAKLQWKHIQHMASTKLDHSMGKGPSEKHDCSPRLMTKQFFDQADYPQITKHVKAAETRVERARN